MTTGQKELIGRRLKISPVSVYHEGLYICEISIAVEGISQSIKQARNVRFLVVGKEMLMTSILAFHKPGC